MKGCYHCYLGLLPLLPGQKKPPGNGAAFLVELLTVNLLPIRLSVARFTQQGGDEVDYFLVRKHEF